MSTRCMNPIIIRYNQADELKVACGKCAPCIRKRVSCWSFRLDKQAEVSTSALFVTLTYNDQHIPWSKKGYHTLDKTDLQKFFKRLRKIHKGVPIKYYACGEYGARTHRPHYHIILFNSNHADIAKAWSLDNKEIGFIHYRPAEHNAIGYTLKYITKEKKVGRHHLDDRAKEFSLMSKGLGQNYITADMIGWHQADLLNRMYCPLKDGMKAPMPRYYKDRIYEKEQLEEIQQHIHKIGTEELEKEIAELGDLYSKTKWERYNRAMQNMYDNAKKRCLV